MEIAMQIHHLDDNEANGIISIINRKSLPNDWFIERPTDETNLVLVRYDRNEDFESEVVERDFLFDNAAELLSFFEKKQNDEIKAFDLNVTLKIMTKEFALPIPTKLLGECGRLGIGIYILNLNSFER